MGAAVLAAIVVSFEYIFAANLNLPVRYSFIVGKFDYAWVWECLAYGMH